MVNVKTSFDVKDWDVWTDSGWKPVTKVHLTHPECVWLLVTHSGKTLRCAGHHLVFLENGTVERADKLLPGAKIITNSGTESVVAVMAGTSEPMYDLSVDSPDHRYYANGVLCHNSVTVMMFLLHYVLFNDDVSIAVLANKEKMARQLLRRLQFAYEKLPFWMQQGVVTWNKGDLSLENGSSILAAATSSAAVRGGTYNILFLDEFAFVPDNISEEFFRSVYPTITSGKSSKVIIVSTPNGMNKFYKMWREAASGDSGYVPFEISWSQVPGRDEAWKREQIKKLGSEEAFDQEFACCVGNTLVPVRDLSTGQDLNIPVSELYSLLAR